MMNDQGKGEFPRGEVQIGWADVTGLSLLFAPLSLTFFSPSFNFLFYFLFLFSFFMGFIP